MTSPLEGITQFFVETFDLLFPKLCFFGAVLSVCGELANRNRRNQESDYCDPVVRIGDYERTYGRQEKVIKAGSFLSPDNIQAKDAGKNARKT